MNTTSSTDAASEGVAVPDNPAWLGMSNTEIVAFEFDRPDDDLLEFGVAGTF